MEKRKRKSSFLESSSPKKFKEEEDYEQKLYLKIIEVKKLLVRNYRLEKQNKQLENKNKILENNFNDLQKEKTLLQDSNIELEDKITKMEKRMERIEKFNQDLREKNLGLEEELQVQRESEMCDNFSNSISIDNSCSYIS